MDQRTASYKIDRKSKYQFYLRIFFDLTDVVLVNSHIVYMKLCNKISLLSFKVVVAKYFIGRYSSRKRSFPAGSQSKWKLYEPSMPREVPPYMFDFQEKWIRCHYCKNKGPGYKTFVSCQTCGLRFCLTK